MKIFRENIENSDNDDRKLISLPRRSANLVLGMERTGIETWKLCNTKIILPNFLLIKNVFIRQRLQE